MTRHGIVLFVVVTAFLGCADRPETEVRQKFDIPFYKLLSEESIAGAVTRKLPVGTKEKDIYEILRNINIGADEFSSFYEANEKGEIVVRFDYDPDDWGLVKKHYGIIIKLDDARTLESVEVREWLTGL